jgi:PHYB activation tagged suppressor 1
MNEQFQRLTIDIIAHTAFGSSYVQGKEAFKEKKKLQKCCVALSTLIFILRSSLLPYSNNSFIPNNLLHPYFLKHII